MIFTNRNFKLWRKFPRQKVSDCKFFRVRSFSARCRANMAHIEQSRPDYDLGFQWKVLDFFKVVPSSPGSGTRMTHSFPRYRSCATSWNFSRMSRFIFLPVLLVEDRIQDVERTRMSSSVPLDFDSSRKTPPLQTSHVNSMGKKNFTGEIGVVGGTSTRQNQVG